MKRFFFKFSLFFLPLVLLFAVIEIKLAGMPNTYSQKKEDFENQLSGIQVLVLGPSHSLHGINPAYFSHKGYNLANASQTLYYDKELTLRNIDDMPALRLVIIPISYNSLYTQLYDSKERFRCYFYSKYWKIDAPDITQFDLRNYSDIALYTPQTTVEFLSKGFKVNLTEGLSSNGYIRYDTAGCIKNISYSLGAKRVELYRRMMKEEHYSENIDYLTQLVTILREKNIQVCFITTPVYKTYSAYCEPGILNTNASAISTLCKEHGCGYINYFNDNRFTIKDFYDNDHLNFIGAARFSIMLDKEVISKVSF